LENAVAHPSKCLAKSGPLGAIVARTEWQGGLGSQCEFEKVRRPYVSRAEPGPPRRHEAAPHLALAVGRHHHLLDIAEKALAARDLEHAAHGLRPGFVTADRARSAGSAGGDPGPTEDEAGGNEASAIGADPFHQLRMPETAALRRASHPRIEPD